MRRSLDPRKNGFVGIGMLFLNPGQRSKTLGSLVEQRPKRIGVLA